ncbi:MAG: L-2-amino-thiazoline-4-carboxylic acid hydrolase [bacterium]|nr:L-2-amino-thiazoline-4-carboxylic acid hydrolase [bacterium]
MSADDLTMYERINIHMEYAVPLVRSLQRILGEEVVINALEERMRQDIAVAREGPSANVEMSAFAAGVERYAAGGALEYEVLVSDEEYFDMDVTRCTYKETMEQIEATDIGHLLICNPDFAVAERAGMELTRTQTCMQGAPRCDFRYRKRS